MMCLEILLICGLIITCAAPVVRGQESNFDYADEFVAQNTPSPNLLLQGNYQNYPNPIINNINECTLMAQCQVLDQRIKQIMSILRDLGNVVESSCFKETQSIPSRKPQYIPYQQAQPNIAYPIRQLPQAMMQPYYQQYPMMQNVGRRVNPPTHKKSKKQCKSGLGIAVRSMPEFAETDTNKQAAKTEEDDKTDDESIIPSTSGPTGSIS